MKELEGVKSAKVSFQTKQAAVEFDESTTAASEVAQEMAATPHMMGKEMQYGGALLLKANRMSTSRDTTAVQSALNKVQGVSKVTPDTRSQTVAVEFAAKGKVKTTDLTDAAQRAGYTLTALDSSAAGSARRRSRGNRGGSGGS